MANMLNQARKALALRESPMTTSIRHHVNQRMATMAMPMTLLVRSASVISAIAQRPGAILVVNVRRSVMKESPFVTIVHAAVSRAAATGPNHQAAPK